MSRSSLVIALMSSLLLVAPCVHAAGGGGVRLSWNHCAGEFTGAQNAIFPCTVNGGGQTAVGSFVLDADFPAVVGVEVFVDLATLSSSLPPWWQMQAGGCRSGSLGVNFVPEPTNTECHDWSGGLAQGGLATYCTIAGECIDHPTAANAARVKLVSAVLQEDAQDLVGGLEYFAFNLVLGHARSAGAGACAGCNVPACIAIQHINVVSRGSTEERFLTAAYEPGGNAISWQGGGGLTVGPGMSCPAVTASRTSTWGSVKSLYR